MNKNQKVAQAKLDSDLDAYMEEGRETNA
jgi:hypothetical protein